MKQMVLVACLLTFAILATVQATTFDGHEGLTNVLLREMVARMGNDLVDPSRDYSDIDGLHLPIEGISPRALPDAPLDYDSIGMQPSIRDQEYLAHSSLLGTMMGPYGYDDMLHRLKVPSSLSMGTSLAPGNGKPDGILPAYCTPPNPCPIGFTADDGCIEDFENTAGFSRDYQSMQECMCDTEHMFRCPDSTPDSEITALARSIQNEGELDNAFDKIMSQMNTNPYLAGEKLPVAAKKGNTVW